MNKTRNTAHTYIWGVCMDENEEKGIHEENVTKYGEFVCTAYKWLPLEKQKQDAERFEEITKQDRNS